MVEFLFFTNDGELNPSDIQEELVKNRQLPVVVYEEAGKKILPVFLSRATLRRFSERNFGPLLKKRGIERKDFIIGSLEIVDDVAAALAKLDAEKVILRHPRKIQDWEERYNIEVLELEHKPEVFWRSTGKKLGLISQEA